jgi:hypothetical protein
LTASRTSPAVECAGGYWRVLPKHTMRLPPGYRRVPLTLATSDERPMKPLRKWSEVCSICSRCGARVESCRVRRWERHPTTLLIYGPGIRPPARVFVFRGVRMPPQGSGATNRGRKKCPENSQKSVAFAPCWDVKVAEHSTQGGLHSYSPLILPSLLLTGRGLLRLIDHCTPRPVYFSSRATRMGPEGFSGSGLLYELCICRWADGICTGLGLRV